MNSDDCLHALIGAKRAERNLIGEAVGLSNRINEVGQTPHAEHGSDTPGDQS